MTKGTSDTFWIVLLIVVAFSAGRFFPVETVVERIVQERIETEESRGIVQNSRNTTLAFQRDERAIRHAQH